MTRDWPRNNGFSPRIREKAGGRGEHSMEKSKANQSITGGTDIQMDGCTQSPLSYHTDLLRFWSIFYWLFIFFFHASRTIEWLTVIEIRPCILWLPSVWFPMSKSISILIVPKKEGPGPWRSLKMFPTFSLGLAAYLPLRIKAAVQTSSFLHREHNPSCQGRSLFADIGYLVSFS